jgi:FMN phosphatase YigB (HAD superfamily)
VTTATQLLILDFDGTVCIGDDPVFEYAQALDRRIQEIPGREHSSIVPDVQEYLSITDRAERLKNSSEHGKGENSLYSSLDGYAAANFLAEQLGVSGTDRNAAYLESRDILARGTLTTHAPAGLHGFLESLPKRVQRVLVTNAPAQGVTSQLEALGLVDLIDRTVTDAQKPQGMRPICQQLLNEFELRDTPERVMSVGDIWVNDLQPVAELGGNTAYIDRHGARDGSPTVRGTDFASLFDAILLWAHDPQRFAITHNRDGQQSS